MPKVKPAVKFQGRRGRTLRRSKVHARREAVHVDERGKSCRDVKPKLWVGYVRLNMRRSACDEDGKSAVRVISATWENESGGVAPAACEKSATQMLFCPKICAVNATPLIASSQRVNQIKGLTRACIVVVDNNNGSDFSAVPKFMHSAFGGRKSLRVMLTGTFKFSHGGISDYDESAMT